MAETTTNQIKLRSSDNEEFIVPEAVAKQSLTIHHMIEDDCANDIIPLPNVSSNILAKVIEYCSEHFAVAAKKADALKLEPTEEGGAAESPAVKTTDKDLKKWDAEFVNVDRDMLYDLILAANYLNIKGLLDLTCEKTAGMIRGKSPEEIRKTFDIKNDFSPEMEAEIVRENSWAFE